MAAWEDLAACKGSPSHVFYDRDYEDRAKAVCAGCLVSDACLQAAIDGREEFGVWGGMTARDRLRAHWIDAVKG